MDLVTQQIAALLAFGLALLLLNLKAGSGSGSNWLKFITLWAMLAAFAGAGYLVVEWVFFP